MSSDTEPDHLPDGWVRRSHGYEFIGIKPMSLDEATDAMAKIYIDEADKEVLAVLNGKIPE